MIKNIINYVLRALN